MVYYRVCLYHLYMRYNASSRVQVHPGDFRSKALMVFYLIRLCGLYIHRHTNNRAQVHLYDIRSRDISFHDIRISTNHQQLILLEQVRLCDLQSTSVSAYNNYLHYILCILTNRGILTRQEQARLYVQRSRDVSVYNLTRIFTNRGISTRQEQVSLDEM